MEDSTDYLLKIRRGRRNEDNRVATQKRQTNIFLNLPILHLFSIVKNNVYMNIKCHQRTNILLLTFKLHENFLSLRCVEQVQRSLNFIHHICIQSRVYLNLSHIRELLKRNKNFKIRLIKIKKRLYV